MDEVELLRNWGGPGPEPSEASITVARAAPLRSIEAFLAVRPQLAKKPLSLAGLGALLLVLVGWITPISNSFVGGVPLTGIWVSMASVGASGWSHLLSSDLAFGAGAGVIGFGLAWVLNQEWRHLAERFGLRASS